MNNKNSGCAMAIGGILILGALLWIVGVALWALAIVVPLVGLFFGVSLFVEALKAHNSNQQYRAAEDELEALVQDASFDLSETIIRWDSLMLTKGIGTALEGKEQLAESIHLQLRATHELLEVASTPSQQIDAVSNADALRLKAQSYL
ncbi:hypothetical protein [Corynebacterium alimapuense]|uniref:Uncharacterized protein n=1 Tax=Corynebacterium alimapuense TaxID=1576874 RepID=A0A3M8K8D7_9CORY|nr:hypothetical protein [Corynebacterium alimapuense]RNE48774.1 hypothetical protein C5L39_05555 [Corynebacterium alimapuense]